MIMCKQDLPLCMSLLADGKLSGPWKTLMDVSRKIFGCSIIYSSQRWGPMGLSTALDIMLFMHGPTTSTNAATHKR